MLRTTVKLLVIATLHIGLLDTGIANAASDRSSVHVPVFDSDFLHPEVHHAQFDLSGVTQNSPNRLELGQIHLELVDQTLGDLNLARIIASNGQTLNLNERYALEVLFACKRAFDFYEQIGFPLPQIALKIQDPSLPFPPIASQGPGFIKIYRISDPQTINGRVHPFTDFIPFIFDVVAHEVSHHAQRTHLRNPAADPSDPRNHVRLGPTMLEGHADLMAYMISGRPDLGPLPNNNSKVKHAYFKADQPEGIFGRIVDTYESYAPFSSVLVELHDRLVAKASSVSDKIRLHRELAKAYFRISSEASPDDDYRSLAYRLLADLQSSGICNASDFQFVSDQLKERGLDLTTSNFEGYTNTFLVNGKTPDRSPDLLREDALKENTPVPKFEAQSGAIEALKNDFPLRVFLLGGSKMGAVISKLFSDWMSSFPAGHPPTEQEIHRKMPDIFAQATAGGADLDGVFVPVANKTLAPTDSVFAPTAIAGSNPSVCIDGFVFAQLVVFDKNSNRVGAVQMPFKCLIPAGVSIQF